MKKFLLIALALIFAASTASAVLKIPVYLDQQERTAVEEVGAEFGITGDRLELCKPAIHRLANALKQAPTTQVGWERKAAAVMFSITSDCTLPRNYPPKWGDLLE